MRTTINLAGGLRLVLHPSQAGGMVLTVLAREAGRPYVAIVEAPMTPDEAGALIFGAEQAIEASEVARDRCLHCAGDGLCSVPAACQTPIACGVPV